MSPADIPQGATPFGAPKQTTPPPSLHSSSKRHDGSPLAALTNGSTPTKSTLGQFATPSRVTPVWLVQDRAGTPIATIAFDERADPEFWTATDKPTASLYTHTMAVTRPAAGRAICAAMLDWASGRAGALAPQASSGYVWTHGPGTPTCTATTSGAASSPSDSSGLTTAVAVPSTSVRPAPCNTSVPLSPSAPCRRSAQPGFRVSFPGSRRCLRRRYRPQPCWPTGIAR